VLPRRDAEERRKELEKAQRLVLRGEPARAAALLEALLARWPDDERILLKLADVRRGHGDDAGAAAAFKAAASVFESQGFHLKATAALRQALPLAPGDLTVLASLADASLRMQLTREAIRYLEALATALVARDAPGDRERAVTVRRRVLDLLPGDLGATVRLADLLVHLGERGQALALLRDAVRGSRAAHASDEWLVLRERIADLAPGDHRLALDLARALLARASPKRALVRLKPALETHRDDPDTLRLVADAFEALGQVTKAGAAWRELARLHQRRGDGEAARRAWERLRELLPHDAEAAVALAPRGGVTTDAELAEAAFLAAQGMRDGLTPEEPTLEDLELVEVDEDDTAGVERRDGTTTVVERAREPGVDPAEFVARRDLAVAYLEMGQYDQAIAELERAVGAEPHQAGGCAALLGRCHLERGAPREAADAYRRALAGTLLSFEAATAVHYELGLALEASGDEGGALTHFEEAARMDPRHRDVVERVAALVGRGVAPGAAR
jgi:tetratricopeptide (TPR) repeat protein